MASCPFKNNLCSSECACYNPFLRGCAFAVNLLAVGEELANCKQEIKNLRVEISLLNDDLKPVIERMSDVIESLGESILTGAEILNEREKPVIIANNTSEEVNA